MAGFENLGSTNDQDIDEIVKRMRQSIPEIPYYLSVPSNHPYRIINPTLTAQWRANTWFEPHEEHLQYSTFVWRNPSTSLFQLNTYPEHDAVAQVRPRIDVEPSPSGGPKKKISLAAYNKNKSRMNEAQGKPENAQHEPGLSLQTGTSLIAPSGLASSLDTPSLNGEHTVGSRPTPSERSKDREEQPKKYSSNPTQRQKQFGETSMPWLPSCPREITSDSLPPRLSPLVPEASILSTPSPGALQRHALSSLSGSASTPLQITIALPSRFNTDTDETARPKQGGNDSSSLSNNAKADARHVNGDLRRPSLIVKLRMPLLRTKTGAQKRKSEDGSADELERKHTRRPKTQINGENTDKSHNAGRDTLNGSRASSVPPKNGPTAAEWQAEAVRLSRLGKKSKIASSTSSKQAEQAADVKDEARLRKVAAVQALESLLLFLQSFVAKTQSRPKLSALLADWVTLLPYSSDVVSLARRFAHLEGLGLLLQSVASAQIVRICNSISKQQQQQQQEEAQDGNDDDRNRDSNESMVTLHKYSLYSQQKAAEADKKLTRRTLSHDYPKAYAASLDQSLGGGLQPMPAFRMAVLLIDEWSSHQGIDWQPIDEGLCKTL